MTRTPTRQELKQWRESNRFTKKKAPEPELDEGEEAENAFLEEVAQTVAIPVVKTPKLKRAPAPLNPLTTREGAKLRKSYPTIDATLDLHGLTKLEAYARVKSFLAAQYRAGRRHVLVITGKGRTGEGILRSELPHWLNEAPLRSMISAFTHGKPEKGGNGVTHVLLKAYRDR